MIALTYVWDTTKPNQAQGRRESEVWTWLFTFFEVQLLGILVQEGHPKAWPVHTITFPSGGWICMPLIVTLTWEEWIELGFSLLKVNIPLPSPSWLTFLQLWSPEGVAIFLCGRNQWGISSVMTASSALFHSVPAVWGISPVMTAASALFHRVPAELV